MSIDLEILQDKIDYMASIFDFNIKNNIRIILNINYNNFEYFTKFQENFIPIIINCVNIYKNYKINYNIDVIIISILFCFYILTLLETHYDDLLNINSIIKICKLNIIKHNEINSIIKDIICCNDDECSRIRKSLLGIL